MNIDRSSFIPTIDSFQIHIPLTSTPKRSNRSLNNQPLSSTLSMSTDSSKQFELSISAITFVKKSPMISSEHHSRSNHHRRRRSHLHPSTIIKRIELKYLLYSTRAMKSSKQRQYTEADMKIYVIWQMNWCFFLNIFFLSHLEKQCLAEIIDCALYFSYQLLSQNFWLRNKKQHEWISWIVSWRLFETLFVCSAF